MTTPTPRERDGEAGKTPVNEDVGGVDEGKTQSIASLRSRFENLSSQSAGSSSSTMHKSGSAGAKASGDHTPRPIVNGAGVIASGMPRSRPTTPGAQTIPVLLDSAPTSKWTPPAVARKPMVPAKPIIMSTPASPVSESGSAQMSSSDKRLSTAPNSRSASPQPVPAASRRPAPTVPTKPTRPTTPVTASTSPTIPQEKEKEHEVTVTSVKALRDRFNSTTTSGTDGSARPLQKLQSFETAQDHFTATPAISRQTSSEPQPILSGLKATNGSETQLATSPAQEAEIKPSVKTKGPPPPPPLSRTSSPRPTQGGRVPSENQVEASTSTATPTITDEPVSDSRDAASDSQPRPPLPVRKATLAPTDSLPVPQDPPPIPSNRPTIQSPRKVISAEPVSLPPRLPQRSRAVTVSRAEDAQPLSSAPPPLPSRSATAGPGPVLASTPPRAPRPQVGASPLRDRELKANSASSSTDDYQPLPPPARSHTLSISSPAQRPTPAKDGDATSEEDDEEEADPLAGLSSTAKRALEDYPDSTNANRRPPRFSPDIQIHHHHHINSFAVFGRHVCVGSHHVRVYDTQMSDRPIFIVDLKDTGLDFRIKEPKVTAMCFRPASHAKDEGRYLWCGTKDGHLWELDIMTGKVTDTRPSQHSAGVSHIFRYRQNLLSLDESGRLHVFDIPIADKEDTGIPPLLIRTIRISERTTFARLIRGQLWTATAPLTRSTTNAAASKGPTIRVYEPCAEGSVPPNRTLFTTEWTGAVTSATILPLKPDTVYLGHEGGFVSIWSTEEMACVQVLKISASDILSLEGVGERLWAGNRKGLIHVYDVTQRPWLSTNVWIAHPEQPVQNLLVDPWSIEHAGRSNLWSASKESVCAWDGLLSVDWTDCQMTEREAEFCSFREVKLLVCSWNIDSAKPTDLGGSEANATFLEELMSSVDRPDIIVFGFQEVIPLTDKKLTAKTLLFGGKNKEMNSTADKISSAYRHWLDKLTQAVRHATPHDCNYVKIHSESLVGLFTCVFVRSEEKDNLRGINITTVKRGIGGIYGNKGAIVARMIMDDTSMCFINVHLAAGQSQKQARNADLGAIMEDKAILPPSGDLNFVHGGDGTAILDHELVFLNGDLNYRIDQRRENVLSNIQAGDLNFLLEHDQLRKEMRGNHAFRLRSFEEAPIAFAPTYKFNRGTSDYDSSEKRRIPAWCDRILYKKSPRIQALNYQRYEPTISDHKPISAGFKLTVKSINHAEMGSVRGEVGVEWAKWETEWMEKISEAYRPLL